MATKIVNTLCRNNHIWISAKYFFILNIKSAYLTLNLEHKFGLGTRHMYNEPTQGINTYWFHYNNVIMTTMAYQITSLTVVYSTVCSDADQRKHQSSASLAFVWGIHRDRWIPRTRGKLSGKCFRLMTSSCPCLQKILPHEDVMTWTLFPHHWPWMESGGFLSKDNSNFHVLLKLLHKLSNKQSNYLTPIWDTIAIRWRHCDNFRENSPWYKDTTLYNTHFIVSIWSSFRSPTCYRLHRNPVRSIFNFHCLFWPPCVSARPLGIYFTTRQALQEIMVAAWWQEITSSREQKNGSICFLQNSHDWSWICWCIKFIIFSNRCRVTYWYDVYHHRSFKHYGGRHALRLRHDSWDPFN